MSSSPIRITRGVRRVKADEVPFNLGLMAPDAEVVEVLGYRSMRLTLRVVGFDGIAGQPGFLLAMLTGMDLKDPNGFTSVGHFEPITEKPDSVQRVFTDLQRYTRWKILGVNGAEAVNFSIEGVAYR